MPHTTIEQFLAFLPIVFFLGVLFFFFKYQSKRQKPIIDQNFVLMKERNELLKNIYSNLSEISEHLKDLKEKSDA
jgi:hypothetical protein